MSISDVLKDTAKSLDSFLSELSKCGIIGNYTILFLELATFDSYEEACIRGQIYQLVINLQKVLQKLDSYQIISKDEPFQKSPDYFLSTEMEKSYPSDLSLVERTSPNSAPLEGSSKLASNDRTYLAKKDLIYLPVAMSMKRKSHQGGMEDQQVLPSRCNLQEVDPARGLRDASLDRDIKKDSKQAPPLVYYGADLASHKNNFLTENDEHSCELYLEKQDGTLQLWRRSVDKTLNPSLENDVKDPLPTRIGRIVEESLKNQIYDLNLGQKPANLSSPTSQQMSTPLFQQDALSMSEFQEQDANSDLASGSKGHEVAFISDDEDPTNVYSSECATIGTDVMDLPQEVFVNKEKESPTHEKDNSRTVFANIVKFNPSDLDEHPWCQLCQRKFPSSGSLKRHLTTSHNEIHWCHTCLKNFSSKKDMKYHIIKEHPDAVNICFCCGKIFKSHSSLQRHMRIHRGQRGIACEICGQTFARSEYCKIHKRMHTGEKPFSCDVCKKTFSKSSNLAAHALIHKPKSEGHKCNMCPKTFRRLDKLKEHTMRHLKIKRFQCGLCLKAYSEKRDLAKHMKTLHIPKGSN